MEHGGNQGELLFDVGMLEIEKGARPGESTSRGLGGNVLPEKGKALQLGSHPGHKTGGHRSGIGFDKSNPYLVFW
jgi:hypothetical protein